jgi:hypothetical protein
VTREKIVEISPPETQDEAKSRTGDLKFFTSAQLAGGPIGKPGSAGEKKKKRLNKYFFRDTPCTP